MQALVEERIAGQEGVLSHEGEVPAADGAPGVVVVVVPVHLGHVDVGVGAKQVWKPEKKKRRKRWSVNKAEFICNAWPISSRFHKSKSIVNSMYM